MNEVKKLSLIAQGIGEMTKHFESVFLDPGKFQTEFEAFRVMAGTVAGPELSQHLNLTREDMEKYFAEMRTKFSELSRDEMNKAIAKADAAQAGYVQFLAWAKADQQETEKVLNDSYLKSRSSAEKVYPDLLEYMDKSHEEMVARSRNVHEFALDVAKAKYELKLRSYFIFISDETMSEFIKLYAVDVEVD